MLLNGRPVRPATKCPTSVPSVWVDRPWISRKESAMRASELRRAPPIRAFISMSAAVLPPGPAIAAFPAVPRAWIRRRGYVLDPDDGTRPYVRRSQSSLTPPMRANKVDRDPLASQPLNVVTSAAIDVTVPRPRRDKLCFIGWRMPVCRSNRSAKKRVRPAGPGGHHLPKHLFV